MRPIVLYDKSFIQSLNPKKAELFGLLFVTNITPLLIREIGADLLKTPDKKTPAENVSDIAAKLFEPNSYSNVHHRILCVGELCGNPVNMNYKPVISDEGYIALMMDWEIVELYIQGQ